MCPLFIVTIDYSASERSIFAGRLYNAREQAQKPLETDYPVWAFDGVCLDNHRSDGYLCYPLNQTVRLLD